MYRLVVVAMLCACRQVAGLDDPLPGDDAPGVCYGSGIVEVCLDSEPVDDITLDAPIVTDTSPLCEINVNSGPSAACIIVGHGITLPSTANVRVSGARSLVLVAAESISIDGTLDGSSHRGSGGRGPAANFTGCGVPSSADNAGGGAGGSFGGTGGAGGDPDKSTPTAALPAPTELHGGCAGSDGGGDEAGRKGDGGGALYLISGNTITVTGSINASGSGGSGPGDTGASGKGGGGGGSGGMIGFDASSITIAGVVFANGGGGGEGGTSTDQGNNGQDPMGGSAANGGSGGGGGDGGKGGAGAARDGENGGDGTGAGGGGGSAGVILLTGTRSGAGTVSPPPL